MRTSFPQLVQDLQRAYEQNLIANVVIPHLSLYPQNITFNTTHPMSQETQDKLIEYLETECDNVIVAYAGEHKVLIRVRP
jgi:hypothetical protein